MRIHAANPDPQPWLLDPGGLNCILGLSKVKVLFLSYLGNDGLLGPLRTEFFHKFLQIICGRLPVITKTTKLKGHKEELKKLKGHNVTRDDLTNTVL
jgi:hypothetical protein